MAGGGSCAFCDKFRSGTKELQWFDQPLYALGNFLTVAGVGAFSAGYLLILTRTHHTAFADISDEDWADAEAIKNEVVQVVQRKFGPVILFEHGTMNASRAGSCIDHAHLHILPYTLDLTPALSFQFETRRIEIFSQLREQRSSYLFYQNQQCEMYVASVEESLPSQFLRRLVAQSLNIPECWDYALFPNYREIQNTIELLTPWPEE